MGLFLFYCFFLNEFLFYQVNKDKKMNDSNTEFVYFILLINISSVMRIIGRFFLVSLIICFIGACKNEKKTTLQATEKAFEAEIPPLEKSASQEDVVFYNLFSPVDVSKLVDNSTAYYNSSVINALNRITQYNTSNKMALNVGVYGADLSYLWIFQQSQQALSYLSAIQHLTDKLEIPRQFVDLTMESVENSAQNSDTLIAITRKAFAETNRFLSESGREYTSTFILLGGWIESMHIALNMYKVPDVALASKILSQKYSLISLTQLLEKHPEDPATASYLQMMKILDAYFGNMEAKLTTAGMTIDTTNKRIQIHENGLQNIQPANFSDLKEQIQKIRNTIVE